ncbi:hypothetical protein Tco_0980096 [Tanacetum coccineum]
MYSSRRYSVSVPTLHKSPRRIEDQICRIHEDSIRHIEGQTLEDSERYQSWSLLQEIPNMSIQLDDDLFTYEVEIYAFADIPCDLNEEDDSKQQISHETDDDMEYDPSNARRDDEVELTDKESSDSDKEDEVAEIFRIKTNVFNFETPTCRAFKEFNYL